MKKIVALMLALVLCLSLAACGGPDKQPAIDKFNETSTAFNAVAARVNENIDMFDQSNIDTMIEFANLLNQYNELLSADNEIAQEDLDAMIAWFGEVDEWVAAVDAELDKILG